MDGTLFNTEQLVRDSYKDVGVDMPDDAFGKRWDEWLPQAAGTRSGCDRIRFEKSNAMHARATREYLDTIRLAPLDIFLGHQHMSCVATNASLFSAYMHLGRYTDSPMSLIAYATDLNDHLSDKIGFLLKSTGNFVAAGGSLPQLYLDDDEAVVDEVNRRVSEAFTRRPIIAVHYAGESLAELEEKIARA